MLQKQRTFPVEDIVVGCVALIAAAVCALALFDIPTATENRGVSYTEFVRSPAVELPAVPVTPLVPERPSVAETPPLEIPASDLAVMPTTCSPDVQIELQRLLELCSG